MPQLEIYNDNLVSVDDKNLTSIKIPDTINSIGKDVFFSFTYLTTVDLSNVKSIGDYSFYNCVSLRTINLEKVENIGKKSFLCM